MKDGQRCPLAVLACGNTGGRRAARRAKEQRYKDCDVYLTDEEKRVYGKLAGTITKQVLALKAERTLLNKQIAGLEERVRDINIAVEEGKEKRSLLLDVEEIDGVRYYHDPKTGKLMAQEPITEAQQMLGLDSARAN